MEHSQGVKIVHPCSDVQQAAVDGHLRKADASHAKALYFDILCGLPPQLARPSRCGLEGSWAPSCKSCW